MKQIDFGQVANSYAKSREDIPVTLMDSLLLRNIFFDGKKVADIGSGTGELTRKMAMRKAEAVGVEPSIELLGQALALNQSKNFMIPYKQGSAEDTGLEESQYDIVTVMRAWHLFERDKAMVEIKRILKTKGRLIVIDSGLLSESSTVEKSLEVLSKYVKDGLKPAGAKAESMQCINGFPVEWFGEWKQNGFELRDFYKLNYTVSLTKQEWVDRIGSIARLTELDEALRKQALKELADLLTGQGSYVIPYDCNVCILRLVE